MRVILAGQQASARVAGTRGTVYGSVRPTVPSRARSEGQKRALTVTRETSAVAALDGPLSPARCRFTMCLVDCGHCLANR